MDPTSYLLDHVVLLCGAVMVVIGGATHTLMDITTHGGDMMFCMAMEGGDLGRWVEETTASTTQSIHRITTVSVTAMGTLAASLSASQANLTSSLLKSGVIRQPRDQDIAIELA
jgi:hypothetical protein